MKFFLITLLTGFLCISNPFFTQNAHAQRMAEVLFGRDQSERTDPRYQEMIVEALDMPSGYSWTRLRRLYTRSSYFTPFAEEIQLELIAIANQMKEAQTPEEQKEIADQFRFKSLQHLGNADMMSLSYSLTRKDPRLGDSGLYQWALWGLMNVVRRSGDGDKVSEAYNVITAGEETLLFKMLGVNHLGLEDTYSPGFYVFNVHKVQDPATKETYQVFVNITYPMAFLRAQEMKKEKERKLDIPKP